MSAVAPLSALIRSFRTRLVRHILAHRLAARHPTLVSDPTAIWDYQYSGIDAVDLGHAVRIGAYAEIVVYKQVPYSRIEGRLVLGDGAVIATGANVRAAGGAIRVGAGSVIGQNAVVIAANHRLEPGRARFNTPWDESRHGVEIGCDVWIGASSVLLPGCVVGDHSVIGAGSVVRGVVPPNELWAGVPARYIRGIGSQANST